MIYHDPEPISRADASDAFASDDPVRLTDALLRVALFDADWGWAQEHCLRFLTHPQPDVRGLAATCLGHLARIHGVIDRDRVVEALSKLQGDPEVGGRARDALDDIEHYATAT